MQYCIYFSLFFLLEEFYQDFALKQQKWIPQTIFLKTRKAAKSGSRNKYDRDL